MRVLLLLLLAATSFVVAISRCPPNTFMCGDGSCIPEDWVGDGEFDCDGHEDETDAANAATDAKQKLKPAPAPAPAPAPVPAPSPAPAPAAAAPAEEDCPPEHQQRVSECAEPIVSFLREIHGIHYENSSFLADKESQQRVEQGCDLMHEYDICTEGVSKTCTMNEQARQWQQVEMFACQLLLPAVREHEACLGKERNGVCMVSLDASFSPLCRLVASVHSDVACLQRQNTHCESNAAEMIEPILDETAHIVDDIGCKRVAVSAPMPTTTRPSTVPVTEADQDMTAAPTHAPTAAPKQQQQEQEEKEEVEEEEEEATPAPTPATAAPTTTTTPAEQIDAQPSTVQTAEVAHNKPATGSLADAVKTLLDADSVCEGDYANSIWAPVVKTICPQRDTLNKHAECFYQTSTKTKCAVRDASSACDALEAFNANLDCAIVAMNDACSVEAQNVVVEVQEQINDRLIEAKCFAEEEKKEEEKDGDFVLHSSLPKCTDEQENGALACLVELLEINKQLARFQELNFLLEMANENSSVIAGICGLYGKYEKCLDASVFSQQGGKRCSFASPLNTLARIGLAPICSLDSRPLLSNHKQCLARLAANTDANANCQSGLGGMGDTVQKMIQGIHGEALLCKSFYLIEDTFSCGQRAVRENCDEQALHDISTLKHQMAAIGLEEGCPAERPADLDEIIARPVARPAPLATPPPARPTSAMPEDDADAAPMARPLGKGRVSPVPPRPSNTACVPEEQRRFQQCVQPLTAFQPHPLSVIKMPKQIEEACAEFSKFKECTASVDCHPLWARGMAAMFEYACGEGHEKYMKVRHCIRQASQDEAVKECVGTFSRGAPTQACLSANQLLTCAGAPIAEKCGEDGVAFITDYVTKFATAIDPRCRLASQLPIGRVVAVGCSAEEEHVVEHCAAPLNDIGARMEELFNGGSLQNLLKNVNSMAPVFAGGCNLTEEFRQCAVGPLSNPSSSCVVSSCLIQAGQGICSAPDPSKAIDDNLNCVFGQVQEPEFAKCIRSTLATIKQFSLASFRGMLPRFVECVQPVVLDKCGETPIKILKAISSPDLCPIGASPIVPVNKGPQRVQPATCSAARKAEFDSCASSFYAKYQMIPGALLTGIDNMDSVCADSLAVQSCPHAAMCSSREHASLKQFVAQICSARSTFEQHKACLHAAAQANSSACVSVFASAAPADKCAALQAAAMCMGAEVNKCGADAVAFSYSLMDGFAKKAFDGCEIHAPPPPPTTTSPAPTSPAPTSPAPASPVSSAAGCSESDVEAFNACERTLNPFSFRPISIIGDASRWDEFCSAVKTAYSPCVSSLACQPLPVSRAHASLFQSICDRAITLRDQKKHAACLADLTNGPVGQKCVALMADVDPVLADAPAKVCAGLDAVTACAAPDIEKMCGFDALMHVYDLHVQWAQAFNPQCHINSPEPSQQQEETPDVQSVTSPAPEPEPTSTEAAAPEQTSESNWVDDSVEKHPKDVRVVAASAAAAVSVVLLTALLF